MILCLILRLFYSYQKPFQNGGNVIDQKQQLNLLVTVSHIFIIVCLTVASIFAFNVPLTNGESGNYVATLKAAFSWTVIGGVGDLYLTCMIWFIFDDQNCTKIFCNG